MEQYADADAVRAATSALISEANLRSYKTWVGAITNDNCVSTLNRVKCGGVSLWSVATQKTYRAVTFVGG